MVRESRGEERHVTTGRFLLWHPWRSTATRAVQLEIDFSSALLSACNSLTLFFAHTSRGSRLLLFTCLATFHCHRVSIFPNKALLAPLLCFTLAHTLGFANFITLFLDVVCVLVLVVVLAKDLG